MANRKIASELNELLKMPGGIKGGRTLPAYKKNRESAELGDDTSKTEHESKNEDESKGRRDDSEGKSSEECSGEYSTKAVTELTSESKSEAASSVAAATSENSSSNSEGRAEEKTDVNIKEKQVCSGKEKADGSDGATSVEPDNHTGNKSGSDNSTDKRAAARIGESLESKLQKRENDKRLLDKSQVTSHTKVVTSQSQRRSLHERVVKTESSGFSASVDETEQSDVNSNLKKPAPKIGAPGFQKMGFSLDLNRELNAKFAAARQQMLSGRKETPGRTEGKKQPPVPLPRPRRPESLAAPEKTKPEVDESKDVDADTGHIYEDIDQYMKPGSARCELCKEETEEDEEDASKAKDKETKKTEPKKKKKSKGRGLKMFCVCRQTSSDLASATPTFGDKAEDKMRLLPLDDSAKSAEARKADGEGYERLQREKKPSFRGGYEALRNSSPEVVKKKPEVLESKDPSLVLVENTAKSHVTKESVKSSKSVTRNEETFAAQRSERFQKRTSEENFESKFKSSSTKSSRFESRSENVVQESSEEHRTRETQSDVKSRDMVYAKVLKTSHHSEEHSASESVTSSSATQSVTSSSGLSRTSRLERFGAVPVLPIRGNASVQCS